MMGDGGRVVDDDRERGGMKLKEFKKKKFKKKKKKKKK
jgi:hypothetical protein